MKYRYIPAPFVLLIYAVYAYGIEQAKSSSGVNDSIKGTVINYGIYNVVKTGRLVNNPFTSTGQSHSATTIQLVERTQYIPLRIGSYFAFQTRVEYFPDMHFIKLKKVVRHPEMKLPDGSRTNGYVINETKKVSSGIAFAISGYSFDESYELVEGEWIIQYWYGEKLLVEQKFVSYWPEVSSF